MLHTCSLTFLQKFSLKMEVGGFGGPGARGERMVATQCGQVLCMWAKAGAGGEQWARRVL